MIRSKLFMALFFSALILPSYCQISTEDNSRFWDRIYFGGNFGLAFGTITQIDISPIAGYRITPRFSAGVGGTYQYYKEEIKYVHGTYKWETSIYGGKVFGTYVLLDEKNTFLPFNLGSIILQSECEILNVETYRLNQAGYYINAGREWICNILAGGGIRQRIGERSSIDLMILWNLNDTPFSPYSNPVIRLGFNF
jgi:hypothetical protein